MIGNDILMKIQVFDFIKIKIGNGFGNARTILLIKSTKVVPIPTFPLGTFPEECLKLLGFPFPFPNPFPKEKCNKFINLTIPKTFSYYVRECMLTAYSLTLSSWEWMSGKGELKN